MSEQKHYAAIIPTWLQAFEIEAGYMPEQEGKLKENIAKLIESCGFHSNLYHSEEICWESCINLTDQILDLLIADNKSIERIAEELGVNFHDLYPYILMTEKEATHKERERIIEVLVHHYADKTFAGEEWWQALKST